MPRTFARQAAILFLTCLFLTRPAGAEPQHYWEGLGATDEGQFDIDIGSVKKVGPGLIDVTTRHVYSQRIAGQQMQSLHLSERPRAGITDVLIHCDRKQAATVTERIVDKNNHNLVQHATDRLEWQTINPGSVMAGIATVVCPAGSAKAEEAEAESQGPISGTGFVVSDSGHVVTNNHLVRDRKEIFTVIEGGKRPLTVLRTDPVNDLALLKLGEAPPKGLAFRQGTLARAGESIVVLGYPLRGLLANEPNVTTGIVSALAGPRNDSRLLQFTAPVQQGNSGGPLFDECGTVVGMVVGKLDALDLAKETGDLPQNVNFALQADIVLHFLRVNGLEPAQAACGQKLSVSEIAARQRASVLQIVAQ